MKEIYSTLIKYFVVLSLLLLWLFSYYYAPLTEEQQKQEAYRMLQEELVSIDADPKRFKSSKLLVKREEDEMFLWKFERGSEKVYAYVKKIHRRIDSFKKDNVVYRSTSDKAWEMIKNN